MIFQACIKIPIVPKCLFHSQLIKKYIIQENINKNEIYSLRKNVNGHCKYKMLDVQLKTFCRIYSSLSVYALNLSEFILKQTTSPTFTEGIQVLSCLQLLIEPVCYNISFLTKQARIFVLHIYCQALEQSSPLL